MSKDEHRIKVPKLERSGANWVTYRDRFIWALQSESIDDHIAESAPTLDYINLGDVNDMKPQARWKKEEHTINVTSIAGRRWESFILRYAVDLYVQDPIGIIFWMEGTDGGTD